MKRGLRTTSFSAIAVLSLIVASPAMADKPRFGDTLYFQLGGMDHHADVAFSSTLEGRQPVVLDFDDLGLDGSAGSVYAGMEWQFAERWGVNLSYAGFDATGVKSATQDGSFGDIEWTAEATLDSTFDLELYIMDLRWNFLTTERGHFGVGLGLHVMDIKSSIAFSLDGSVNGEIVEIDSGVESSAVTAPLPTVSIRGGYRFGDNFYLGASLGYFDIKIDDVGGELISARGVLEWRPVRNFGVGVGYQYVTVDITEDQSDRRNRIDADFYGPILFVSAGF